MSEIFFSKQKFSEVSKQLQNVTKLETQDLVLGISLSNFNTSRLIKQHRIFHLPTSVPTNIFFRQKIGLWQHLPSRKCKSAFHDAIFPDFQKSLLQFSSKVYYFKVNFALKFLFRSFSSQFKSQQAVVLSFKSREENSEFLTK